MKFIEHLMNIYKINISKVNISKVNIKAFAVTLAASIIFLSLWGISLKSYHEYLLSEKHKEVQSDLALKGSLFSKAIEQRFSLIYGLEAYTQSQISQGLDFSNREIFEEGLFAAVDGIRNLLIAPDGISKYVYPLKGNESVLGHSLINDERPEVRNDLNAAIDTRKLIVSGPYELRQGGQGIVLRKAIFFNNRFWGFVTIAIDMKPIYAATGLLSDTGNIEYAFKNRNGIFYGNKNVFESHPNTYNIEIIDKEFILAAIPAGGWDKSISNQFLAFQFTTLLIVIMLLIIIYMSVYRNLKIHEVVNIKTLELSNAKALLEKELQEREILQQSLREANETLEMRVRERTSQLEESNKELESFTYTVSHDLRAPLRHMVGFVELLNKRLPESLDDKSRHYLEVISDASNQMGRLIDDLLSFSRMGRTQMSSSKVNLRTLVDENIDILKPELMRRNIEWKISELGYVKGDRSMLSLVFLNLISNAVKFTRNKQLAQIEIGLLCNYGMNNETVYYVKDNGAGFDMQYKDKLFSLFQRLHHQSDFEGTGVGLANVQRIIQRHGGRIWAEGILNEGATFYFTLEKYMEE